MESYWHYIEGFILAQLYTTACMSSVRKSDDGKNRSSELTDAIKKEEREV